MSDELKEYEKVFNKAIKNYIQFIDSDVVVINISCKKSEDSINYKIIKERKIIVE